MRQWHGAPVQQKPYNSLLACVSDPGWLHRALLRNAAIHEPPNVVAGGLVVISVAVNDLNEDGAGMIRSSLTAW